MNEATTARHAVQNAIPRIAASASQASSENETYDLALLEQSRAKWQRSVAIRAAYANIYREMHSHSAPGPAIEVGSGCGTMSEFVPHVVTTDVRKTPFVHRAASAYTLEEVPGGPWSTIYLLDVLHHLREPVRFFASAARALRDGGRIVVTDPAATPLGRRFYRLFHHEPISPERIAMPYEFPADNDSGDFANMGMCWALFVRDIESLRLRLAELGLAVHSVYFRDVLAYAATGGFSGPQMLPAAIIRGLLAIERRLPQRLLRTIALRMVTVIEKTGPGSRRDPIARSQSDIETNPAV